MVACLLKTTTYKRERVDNVAQCYRCFSFEHVANQCQRTNPLCSICTEEHNFRDYPNKNNKTKLKCANCGGKHIAIAKSCPKRKEKINEKENEKQQINLQNQQQQKQPSNPLSLDNFPALKTVNNPSTQPPQQNTVMAWANTDIQNNNTDTTHSQQQQPIQPCNIDEYKKHEWEIKLSITKSCAEMAAKGNASRFMEIMKSFLKDIGLSPLNIALDPHTGNTCSNREQHSSSQSSPTIQLPSLTPMSPLFGRTPQQSPNFFPHIPSQTNTSVNTSTPNTHNVTVIERHQIHGNSPPAQTNSNTNSQDQDMTSLGSTTSQGSEKTNDTSINSQIQALTPPSHNTTRDSIVNVDTNTDLFNNTNTNSTHNSQTCVYTDPHTSLSHQITVTETNSDHPTIHIPSPQTQESLHLRLTDTPTRETTSDCPSDQDFDLAGRRKLRRKTKSHKTNSRDTQ